MNSLCTVSWSEIAEKIVEIFEIRVSRVGNPLVQCGWVNTYTMTVHARHGHKDLSFVGLTCIKYYFPKPVFTMEIHRIVAKYDFHEMIDVEIFDLYLIPLS